MTAVRVGLVDWRLPVSGPQAVALAASLGVDGIQLDLGGPGRAPWLDEDGRLRRLQSVLEESGVAPLAISANTLNDLGLAAVEGSELSEQIRSIIIRVLDIAAKLGAELVFLPSFGRSKIDSPETLARTAAVLRWACAEALRRGTMLASENILGPASLRKLIDLVDFPNFRVVLDTGNLFSAGVDAVAVLRTAGRALSNQVHIKGADDCAPLGVGNTAICTALHELFEKATSVDVLVLENDYRSGTTDRIDADARWLRDRLSAFSISGSKIPPHGAVSCAAMLSTPRCDSEPTQINQPLGDWPCL